MHEITVVLEYYSATVILRSSITVLLYSLLYNIALAVLL
jgi:hypothetical protein